MKKFLLLLLVFSLTLALSAQSFPRAQWLHYPEADEMGLNKPRYIWTDVDIPQDIASAEISYHLDDYGFLYIDGKRQSVTKHAPYTEKKPAMIFDDIAVLTPGAHRIEFQVTNGSGAGGVSCRITLRKKDGTMTEIFSDETWFTAKEPSRNGGDGQAVRPLLHDNGTVQHFGAYFEPEHLFCADEIAQLEKAKAEKQAKFQKFLDDLANEPTAPVEIIYENGLPEIKCGDVHFPPILYSVHHYQDFTYNKFVGSFENFRDAGIHQYVMGIALNQYWKGPGEYAFESIDKWMEEAFLRDPEARVIFEIAGRSIPYWWTAKHPEECVKYLNLDEQYKDERDQLNGRFLAPSFASELYLKEYSEFLKALVEYVESKPWSKRVFAYRNDNGVYLEWHYWGMGRTIPDVSEPMQRHFTKFLRERYGTDEALQKAWDNPNVTIDTARLANYEQRITTQAGCYWDPVKDAQAIDSVLCAVDAVANFMLTTNHLIKETCNRRALVGNYYGYFFGMNHPSVGWHLYLNRVLNSPDVDFNCQPMPYGQPFRDFGEAQYSRGLVTSYLLHGKLNIIEADTRTNDVPYDDPHCFAMDIKDTINLLTRDFSQALCTGAGFWYFDFGEGWYAAPETRQYLSKLLKIWNDKTADNSSAAEVLLIGDMLSPAIQSSDNLEITVGSFINHNRKALSHAGVPYDTILLEDLENPNLRQDYKVYIFINTLINSPERTALAQKLRDAGKTVVWLDRAGLFQEHASPNEFSTKALTGFNVKMLQKTFQPALIGLDRLTRMGNYNTPSRVAPHLAIIDKNAEPLGYTAGDVTFARKPNANGGYSYLATMPFLQPRDYLEIFRAAGVHVYCEDEDTAIFANKSHIMLHVDKGAPHLLSLPRECRLVQLLPERKVISENTKEIQIDAKPRSTYLFRME